MMKKLFSFRKAVRRIAGAAALALALLSFSLTAFAEPLPDTVLNGKTFGPGATGWSAQEDGSWRYYLNGSAVTGTWADIGSRWYYLDDAGKMLTGWQNIGGKDYYLEETGNETHPKGSMYVSEKTPDGQTVNENGERVAASWAVTTLERPNPYGALSCVEVCIGEQMMYCYVGQNLMLASPCVTGLPGARATSVGRWKINSKERNRYLQGYNSNGTRYQSWVNYWMPFHGGQGLHDASWRGAFGGDIYTRSGSHGCVNLPPDIAAKLFDLVHVGTPVIVHN